MNDNEDETQKLRGIEMSDEAIDEFLRERGTGVISLSDEGETYSVPTSFGYDGERLYFFLLRFGTESRKLSFIESTETTSFVTYEFDDAHNWRSVVVRGNLVETPEDRSDEVESVMADNAQFANLFPYGEEMEEQVRYQLEVEEMTGQQGHELDS